MIKDFDSYPADLQEFAHYKLTVEGRSEKTVSEYLSDMRTFCRFIVSKRGGLPLDAEALMEVNIDHLDRGFFEGISKNDIFDFLTFVLGDRQNGTAARSRKLSALRSFYKYMTVKRNYFENNPAKDMESPKKKKQLPKHLSVDESIDLLSAVKNDPESKTRERDFCILTLFLNCGMRLSELCGINLGDIDREMKSLRVMGKGSKERVVYLNSACREALSDYLKIRLATREVKEKENALFLSRLGKRISNKTVQWMVKKYLGEAGLEYKHYSTHKLRHTAATLMYQSGDVDIRVLKDILGHEQLNTTQIYTHVSNSGMEAAMEHNPLAKVKIKEKPKDTEQ
ncbi:MAG: tyrosine recombinase XerC [Ruminococcaceae bacterium]|nr:tyrosine recombinase XerC [Oscillospiraceae bacterium]